MIAGTFFATEPDLESSVGRAGKLIQEIGGQRARGAELDELDVAFTSDRAEETVGAIVADLGEIGVDPVRVVEPDLENVVYGADEGRHLGPGRVQDRVEAHRDQPQEITVSLGKIGLVLREPGCFEGGAEVAQRLGKDRPRRPVAQRGDVCGRIRGGALASRRVVTERDDSAVVLSPPVHRRPQALSLWWHRT